MSGKKIVVFGSYVTDLTARTPRFPSEGETVMGSSFQSGPGGKGSNQAIAASRAGGTVSLITRLGEDVFGRAALEFYRQEGLDGSHVILSSDSSTGAALIEVNEVTGQNRIAVVLGACGEFRQEEIQSIKPVIQNADILLCQLETNLDAALEVIRTAHDARTAVILNPAPAAKLPEDIFRQIDYITPNETEASILTGIEVKDSQSAAKAAEVLLEKGVRHVIITLGGSGYYAADGREAQFGRPAKVKVVDTTGAGDAFNGGFAAALADGLSFFDAAEYGNAAGGLSVEKIGTAPAMPGRETIEKLLKEQCC